MRATYKYDKEFDDFDVYYGDTYFCSVEEIRHYKENTFIYTKDHRLPPEQRVRPPYNS